MMFNKKGVVVKMLPFDNKNEFEVVIDMPEGTTLEKTLVVANEIAGDVSSHPMGQKLPGICGDGGACQL